MDTSHGIIFNTNEPTNDLEGSLQGHVMFAQNIIIPSRAATDPRDYRPNLVSLRDTLILFKPLNGANQDLGVMVSISDKDNQQLFNANMLPPDAMPKIASQATEDVDEFAIIEPESYDYVFSSQQKLDQIDEGPEGNTLKNLLAIKSFVRIETADGQWIKDFYLPSMEASDNDVLIVFDIRSSRSCFAHYDGKTMELLPGTKMAFTFIEGTWDTIYESTIKQSSAVKELLAWNRNYATEVRGQRNLNLMADDYEGNRINELLDRGNLIIYTADGSWLNDFYLPKDNAKNEGKFVTFSSRAGYKSSVFYDYGSAAISRGDYLIFVCKNGKWLEYSDEFFSKIKYVDGYWSLKIPMEAVVPEITFSFSHNNLNGVLKNVEIGAPNELLIHTIDIGMLVTPRDDYEFQKESKYHAEYFQQAPLSRLIVAEYEPITFDKVVLPDGTVYTDASATEGGIHTGDMRQRIGKELVSIGINHANYGIHSTKGPSERSPFSCMQLTAHTSRGKYRNGVQNHGMSGGGSIVTLYETLGNELSHEIEHNYGIGHYPNGFYGSVHRSAEHFGSWGWDSVKNVLVPNFGKAVSGQFACVDGTCEAPFQGHGFGYASMAGGAPLYLSTNSFTLHTPYELEKIQEFLENKAVFDPSSSTGYKKWSDDCKCMEEWGSTPEWVAQIEATPTQCGSLDSMIDLLSRYDNIKINFRNGYWTGNIYLPVASAAYAGKVIYIKHEAGWGSIVNLGSQKGTVNYGDELIFVGKEEGWELVDSLPPGKMDVDQDIPRPPSDQGVPVTTLLGYYDPEATLETYVYPALHGAYGNTFDSDSEDEIGKSTCYAKITNESQESMKYALKGYRKQPGNMNKLHINVAESFNPNKITIHCNGELLAEREITSRNRQLTYTVNGRPLPSDEPKTCYFDDTTYTGKVIPGGRLKKIESAAECQQHCQYQADCGGFIFRGGKKLCLLKEEGGRLETNCGRRCRWKVSGLKNCD